MLLHSRTTTVYLTRRSRLFQVYSNHSSSTKTGPNYQAESEEYKANLKTEDMINWLCSFGQSLENQIGSLKTIKGLIQRVDPQLVKQISKQILQIIKIAICFQPASKISNILYYLCRKSYSFRIQALRFLNDLLGQVTKLNKYMNSMSSNKNANENKNIKQIVKFEQSVIIILTDIFIFGINFTQNQFLNQIFPLVFPQKPRVRSFLAQNQHMFQLYFVSHYIQILCRPTILLQKHRQRVLQSVCQFIRILEQSILKQCKKQVDARQSELQQCYSQSQKDNEQVKCKELAFIQNVRRYENLRKQVRNSLFKIGSCNATNNLKTYICNLYGANAPSHQAGTQNNFQHILSSLDTDYPPIIKKASQIEQIKISNKKNKQNSGKEESEDSIDQNKMELDNFIFDEEDWPQYSGDDKAKQYVEKATTCFDSLSNSTISYLEQQQKLLNQIWDCCKNFRNHKQYVRDNIYSQKLGENMRNSSILKSPVTENGYKFIEQVPQYFFEQLKNVVTIQQSNKLVGLFLSQYNKHFNRVKLVNTIFKQFYDRNNVDYIVRVLAGISCEQQQDVLDLVKQQVNKQREKVKGYFYNRLAKGWFGKYSAVTIQFIKFGFISQITYMKQLLQQIKLLNGDDIKIQTNDQTNIANKNSNLVNGGNTSNLGQTVKPPTQTLAFLEILEILQKLGKDVYFKSLTSHILFNKIIRQLYAHIKSKRTCYDIDTINRFNSLVLYLNCKDKKGKSKQDSQAKMIASSELKNAKIFNNIVKKLQRQITNKQKDNQNGVQKICQVLAKSIANQNYMETYLYAQLIYKINSKSLDQSIKQITKNYIVSNLRSGNYQGAANWAKFFGQTHRYNICKQNQFIAFLEDILMKQYFSLYPSPVIKIICSAVDACSNYMKSTKKISQISQTLTFLLVVKKHLFRIKGLKNTILEHQIAEIMQFFHPSFKFIKSSQQCVDLQVKIIMSSNAQKLMDEFHEQSRKKQQMNSQVVKVREINGYACFQVKSQTVHDKKALDGQKQIKSLENIEEKLSMLNRLEDNTEFTSCQKLQSCESQTNSSMIQNKSLSSSNKKDEQPKKLRIIGRHRDGSKKLGKVQIIV